MTWEEWHVCHYCAANVSVTIFKVDKSENLDTVFYVIRFLTWYYKKRKKSLFLDFEKRRKLKTYSQILELRVAQVTDNQIRFANSIG